jgi:hypothetical protein
MFVEKNNFVENKHNKLLPNMFDCLVASKRIHSERIVYKTGGFEILLKLQKAIQGKEGGKVHQLKATVQLICIFDIKNSYKCLGNHKQATKISMLQLHKGHYQIPRLEFIKIGD